MATFNLRGKTITMSEEDVALMKKRLFEFDEMDLISLIKPAVTTGDLDTGLHTPDLNKLIEESSSEQLSIYVARGVSLYRRMME